MAFNSSTVTRAFIWFIFLWIHSNVSFLIPLICSRGPLLILLSRVPEFQSFWFSICCQKIRSNRTNGKIHHLSHKNCFPRYHTLAEVSPMGYSSLIGPPSTGRRCHTRTPGIQYILRSTEYINPSHPSYLLRTALQKILTSAQSYLHTITPQRFLLPIIDHTKSSSSLPRTPHPPHPPPPCPHPPTPPNQHSPSSPKAPSSKNSTSQATTSSSVSPKRPFIRRTTHPISARRSAARPTALEMQSCTI